jgi:hypothetical protein
MDPILLRLEPSVVVAQLEGRAARGTVIGRDRRNRFVSGAGAELGAERTLRDFGLGDMALPINARPMEAGGARPTEAGAPTGSSPSGRTLARSLSVLSTDARPSAALVERRAFRGFVRRPLLGRAGDAPGSLERAGTPQRRTSRRSLASDGLTYARPQDLPGAAVGAVPLSIAGRPAARTSATRPSGPAAWWAERAIEGTFADTVDFRPPTRAYVTPWEASRGVLAALARADEPEELVQAVLTHSDDMRSIVRELPTPAARVVQRILSLGDAALSTRSSERASTAVPLATAPQILQGHSERPATAANLPQSMLSSGRRSRNVESAGSSQMMKLANKLMKLIHLSESERRSEREAFELRMAEDSSSAKSEGSADAGASGGGAANVNLQALQREVLERVLREIELIQHRTQGDSDVWW